jgi:hypothetical protein
MVRNEKMEAVVLNPTFRKERETWGTRYSRPGLGRGAEASALPRNDGLLAVITFSSPL